MTSIEDRQAAQHGDVWVLLRLIDSGDISSPGDDHWIVYDDTRPEGYRVTDEVEGLIRREHAKPEGYYEVFLTDAGRALLTELRVRRTGVLPDRMRIRNGGGYMHVVKSTPSGNLRSMCRRPQKLPRRGSRPSVRGRFEAWTAERDGFPDCADCRPVSPAKKAPAAASAPVPSGGRSALDEESS